MTQQLTETITSQTPELKNWKFKIERVARGYVRVTVHGDFIPDLIAQWSTIHRKLEELGERVEKVQEV